jgi:hypothetical protein
MYLEAINVFVCENKMLFLRNVESWVDVDTKKYLLINKKSLSDEYYIA